MPRESTFVPLVICDGVAEVSGRRNATKDVGTRQCEVAVTSFTCTVIDFRR
jgi:hypothetical protein